MIRHFAKTVCQPSTYISLSRQRLKDGTSTLFTCKRLRTEKKIITKNMSAPNENSKFNADELHAPDWLNATYIENIVRNFETKNADIEIIDYKITPGTAKNDHYGSVIFRIRVDYKRNNESKQQSMILKTMPQVDGTKKELMQNTQVFETEIRMFSETLPKIEAVLRKHGDETKLSAKLLYSELERKVIVFEDLVAKGYTVVPARPCTLDEVKLAMTKVAKLHAISYKLAAEGDKSVTTYEKGSFNTVDPHEFPLTRDATKIFKEAIAEQEDLKMYVPHVEKIEKQLLQKCVDSFNAYKNGERKGIFVLIHGDFHIKNLMVQYNKQNEFQDLLLVDYQMCMFGSPALDILYSTIMLFSPEMRRNNRDELLYHYYANFKQTLQLVEFAGHIPTFKEMRDEFNKHKHWEVFLNISFLLINRELQHADGDITRCVENEDYRKFLLRTPEVQQQLRFILPRLLHQGYFED